MNKSLVMIDDDWKGHATKKVVNIVKEDQERYLCTEEGNYPTIILKKNEEYHVIKKKGETTIYSCFGVDEKIVDYTMLKYRLSETEGHIEFDDESEKILYFLKRYQQNYKHLFID